MVIYTEQEIRTRFEQNYLLNNKHHQAINEHGFYVIPDLEQAWCGFKAAFELINKPGFGYIAIKLKDEDGVKFHITKEDYFKQYGLMQHMFTNKTFTDFVETDPHVLVYKGNNLSYGTSELLELGFKIIPDGTIT